MLPWDPKVKSIHGGPGPSFLSADERKMSWASLQLSARRFSDAVMSRPISSSLTWPTDPDWLQQGFKNFCNSSQSWHEFPLTVFADPLKKNDLEAFKLSVWVRVLKSSVSQGEAWVHLLTKCSGCGRWCLLFSWRWNRSEMNRTYGAKPAEKTKFGFRKLNPFTQEK